MSEETDQGVKSIVVGDGHRSDWVKCYSKPETGGPASGCSPILDHSAVVTTGNELSGGFDLGSGVRQNELELVEESLVIGPQEDPISSPVRSFSCCIVVRVVRKG